MKPNGMTDEKDGGNDEPTKKDKKYLNDIKPPVAIWAQLELTSSGGQKPAGTGLPLSSRGKNKMTKEKRTHIKKEKKTKISGQ